jgi:hypothetical protein
MKRNWMVLLLSLAASTASAQLQIQSARWQVIGGQRGCDALQQMAQACNGKSYCQVTVDPRYICGADPAPGRVKTLNVGYTCYGRQQPILAFADGAKAALRCEQEGRRDDHDRLQIYSARWEVIGGGPACDATRQLIDACDGKSHCEMLVDPRYLCHGDPAPGQLKQLDVRYGCNGERQPPRAFPDFSEVDLRCGRHWPGNPAPVINLPPVSPRVNLHINSARWEAVGGGGWCDATAQVAQACDGKKNCQLPVDERYVCGKDPAPGRNKNLVIGYACNGQQQTPVAYPDFATAALRCDGHGNPPPPPPPHRPGILQVQSARWEVIGGGGWCDATPQMAQACNGKSVCRIRVDERNLCNGDPAPGQLKSLDVNYSCDGRPKGPIGFPDFANAELRCE